MRLLLLVLLLSFAPTAQAHPVTYGGGWVFANTTHPERNDTRIHYSFNPKLAFGAVYTRAEDKNERDSEFVIPRFNYLLKRWNNPGSQANIYLYGGLGAGWEQSESGFAAIAGAQADYETRRFYTQFNTESIQGESDNDFQMHSYRIGVAPYLAEFDEVQTFLIGSVSHTPEMEDEWTAGPIIRIFYKDYLVELGAHSGKFMGTVMFHY